MSLLPFSVGFGTRVAAMGGELLPDKCELCREVGTRASIPSTKGPAVVCAVCDRAYDMPKIKR